MRHVSDEGGNEREEASGVTATHHGSTPRWASVSKDGSACKCDNSRQTDHSQGTLPTTIAAFCLWLVSLRGLINVSAAHSLFCFNPSVPAKKTMADQVNSCVSPLQTKADTFYNVGSAAGTWIPRGTEQACTRNTCGHGQHQQHQYRARKVGVFF